jgi:hypothetical protein
MHLAFGFVWGRIYKVVIKKGFKNMSKKLVFAYVLVAILAAFALKDAAGAIALIDKKDGSVKFFLPKVSLPPGILEKILSETSNSPMADVTSVDVDYHNAQPPSNPHNTPPTISSFTASPSSIVPFDGGALLSWVVYNAASVAIEPDIGPVAASSSGSAVVSPSVTTPYTLTATNNVGSVSQSVQVTVMPPAISSFTANPSVITPGQSSVLTWSVAGAASLTIDQEVGDVTGLSSVTVSPTQTTTYTLTATNSAGPVTQQVQVTVNSPEPNVQLPSQTIHDDMIDSARGAGQTIFMTRTASISAVALWASPVAGWYSSSDSYLAIYSDSNGSRGDLLATSTNIVSLYPNDIISPNYYAPREVIYSLNTSTVLVEGNTYWLVPTIEPFGRTNPNDTAIFGSDSNSYQYGFWSDPYYSNLDAYFLLRRAE